MVQAVYFNNWFSRRLGVNRILLMLILFMTGITYVFRNMGKWKTTQAKPDLLPDPAPGAAAD